MNKEKEFAAHLYEYLLQAISAGRVADAALFAKALARQCIRFNLQEF